MRIMFAIIYFIFIFFQIAYASVVTINPNCIASSEANIPSELLRPSFSFHFRITNTTPPRAVTHSRGWDEWLNAQSSNTSVLGACAYATLYQLINENMDRFIADCRRQLATREPAIASIRSLCRRQVERSLNNFYTHLDEAFYEKEKSILPFENLSQDNLDQLRGQFASVATALQNNCNYMELTPEARAIALSKQFIDNHLNTIMAQATPQCRGDIVQSMHYQIQDSYLHCQNATPTAGCDRINESMENILSFSNYWLSLTAPNSDAACFIPPGFDPAIFTINRWEEINNCVPLVIGESGNTSFSYTGDETPRAIRRISENHYQLTLNLNFSPTSQSREINRILPDCLQQFNQALARTSSDVGRVEVLLAPIGSTEPSPISINIGDSGIRSYSTNWAADIDCETISHEMLHLLGLVDEYEETASGYIHTSGSPNAPPRYADNIESESVSGEDFFNNDFDCRAESNLNSIMNDQYSAFESVENSSSATLLNPAQFRALTEPGCTFRNINYAYCSQFAYTSTPNGALDCPVNNPCRYNDITTITTPEDFRERLNNAPARSNKNDILVNGRSSNNQSNSGE